MQHLYSHDVLDQFRSGRKEFSNIHLNFCILEDISLEGLTIKDSTLEFVSFRTSNLKNARFINCDMFFVSFYGCTFDCTIFDKCKMNIVRLDDMHVKDSCIKNSDLSFCPIIGTNLGELKIQNTSEFKVIRNISEVSYEDAEQAFRMIGSRIEFLPIEIRLDVVKVLNRVANEFNQPDAVKQGIEKSDYKKTGSDYNKSVNAYKALDALSEQINAYGKEAYKQRKPYDK
ncbi:MAG: hypothetical protein AABX14_00445 [Candidatus Aenigmatarchaeota archaeon]